MPSVALFPIPNMVSFPGTIVPLHVFEPRYRKLVHDCVAEGRMIGVCHTRKALSQPKRQQPIEEALASNQTSYEPEPVFSAGHCEILQTTPDGRILVNVHMQNRYSIVGEIQAIPYRIVECEAIEDEQDDGDPADLDTLKRQVNERLIDLVRPQSSELAEQLESEDWASIAAEDYSFRLFQFLKLDADYMQQVLETRNARDRLQLIWDLIQPR